MEKLELQNYLAEKTCEGSCIYSIYSLLPIKQNKAYCTVKNYAIFTKKVRWSKMFAETDSSEKSKIIITRTSVY